MNTLSKHRSRLSIGLLFTSVIAGCQTLMPLAEPTAAETQQTAIVQTTVQTSIEPTHAIPVITPAYEQFSEQPELPVTTEPEQVVSQPELLVEPLPESAPDLWQLTRENFGLDHSIDNPRTQAQLNWYSRHPKYLDRMADRARRYYHYVLHQTIERGLPSELALLPIVESAYDPFAYSHGRAAGPWQFIPMTAKRFKLKHSWWYDGRRDIQASTTAALDYLELLNKRFDGDWLLALAAYNAGGGNVSKAVRKNRERGLPIDFWSLKLPKETSAYVPKLIALAKLFDAPESYNLTLKSLPNQPYFTAVDTGSQIDLAKAAQLAEISIEELYLLNPGFNQWATDPEGPHQLLIPFDKAETFQLALQDYPADKRVSWARYKIKPGDSLISIAKRHNTTVDTLRSTNSISGNRIRAGQMMLIPKASQQAKTYAYSQGQRQAKKNQRIALRSGKDKLSYKVRSGDSFWKISRQYGVGTRELAAWNQMAPGDPLKIGQKLVIWQPAGTVSSQTTLASSGNRQVIRKIGYKVRNGDSLARIASKFSVNLNDIKRWNSKAAQAKYLKPGQHLTLYVDVTQLR
ncbi:MAG: LysM peptidoglycan-binding domain-containing protein [Halopseudomonas sp.]